MCAIPWEVSHRNPIPMDKPGDLFIEFMHDVRSATRFPMEKTQKVFLKISKLLDQLQESW